MDLDMDVALKAQSDQIARLTAENAALRVDAKRMRWVDDSDDYAVCLFESPYWMPVYAKDIDAAMKDTP